MQRYDLALYGHLTIDRMFNEHFKKSCTLGAMANVWDALVSIDTSLSIDLQPTALGEAIIIINEKQGTRLGRGQLNLKTRKCTPAHARWHHVMYLNQLKDVSFISDIEGIVSADITSGDFNNREALKHIDYLFISDEDLCMDLKSLASEVRGSVVLHYPAGSIITDGDIECKTETTVLEKINVLGAGDIFAACFINHSLTHPTSSMSDRARYAHDTTTSLLVKRKNGR